MTVDTQVVFCAAHPESAAITTCGRCGSFACAACTSPASPRLCTACADRQMQASQVPWERHDSPLISRYLTTLFLAVFKPRTFYSLSSSDNVPRALSFAAINWHWVLLARSIMDYETTSALELGFAYLLLPVQTLAATLVWSVIMFVLFGFTQRSAGFGRTFFVGCYASAIFAFAAALSPSAIGRLVLVPWLLFYWIRIGFLLGSRLGRHNAWSLLVCWFSLPAMFFASKLIGPVFSLFPYMTLPTSHELGGR